MCSIFGISGWVLAGVLAIGAVSLSYNVAQIFKAGIKWVKHKFNLDEPKDPA